MFAVIRRRCPASKDVPHHQSVSGSSRHSVILSILQLFLSNILSIDPDRLLVLFSQTQPGFPTPKTGTSFTTNFTSTTMPPISSKVKINVDLGEGYGNFKAGPDDELIPLIDYANIACGGHAGDPMIMHQTVKACKAHNIAMGAHPGLPDIQGFGRRYIRYDPEELTAIVRYQIGALKGFLDAEGVKLHHVKPHGTLYGMCYQDIEVCRAVYAAVPKGTPVFGLAGTIHEQVAEELGLPFFAEAYGDVKYNKDGTLVIDRKKK
jgi:lactam utilization protein B